MADLIASNMTNVENDAAQTARVLNISHRTVEMAMYAGCIGVASAANPIGDYRLLPAAAQPHAFLTGELEEPAVSAFSEMERPSVVYQNGIYHLFFHGWWTSIHPEFRRTALKEYRPCDSYLYHLVAEKPSGPFRIPAHRELVVTGSCESGLYGVQIYPEATPSHSGPHQATRLRVVGWYLQRGVFPQKSGGFLELGERFELIISSDNHASFIRSNPQYSLVAKTVTVKRGSKMEEYTQAF